MTKHNPVDSLGNIQVDFVWGNMPLQPDDQRGEDTLDPALDNHYIADEGWNNYPGYTPNTIGDGDPYLNIICPNVVGLNKDNARTILERAHLVVTGNPIAGGTATISNVYAHTSYDYNNRYAEITTSAPHGFSVGNVVNVIVTSTSPAISGSYLSQFNGTKTITYVESTKFRFSLSSNNYGVSNRSAVGTVVNPSRHFIVTAQSIAPFATEVGSTVDYGDEITITYYN